jgi:hypothetical protein
MSFFSKWASLMRMMKTWAKKVEVEDWESLTLAGSSAYALKSIAGDFQNR